MCVGNSGTGLGSRAWSAGAAAAVLVPAAMFAPEAGLAEPSVAGPTPDAGRCRPLFKRAAGWGSEDSTSESEMMITSSAATAAACGGLVSPTGLHPVPWSNRWSSVLRGLSAARAVPRAVSCAASAAAIASASARARAVSVASASALALATSSCEASPTSLGTHQLAHSQNNSSHSSHRAAHTRAVRCHKLQRWLVEKARPKASTATPRGATIPRVVTSPTSSLS